MNELQVILHGDIEIVDSREVAAMVDREHKELMKSIRQYVAYLNEGEISPVDFFIESNYTDSKGETRPCYLITKKGCDMIAHKMTGKKGVLFTAAYVTAFEKMREHIQKEQLPPPDHYKTMNAEAKLNNSRAKLAAIWMQLAQANPIPEYRQICAHYASAELTGGTAVLPLPESTEKTYTAKEVGEMLGGISANMVGRLANKNGLKTREYGIEVWDKSAHSAKQVQSWRYNDKAVDRLRELCKAE